MAFYANIGYRFTLPRSVSPDGTVILCSAMPRPQLERRALAKHKHLAKRVFDPQLYLAGLDPAESPAPCARLASYPWFGVSGIPKYESGKQTQSAWREEVQKTIAANWRGTCPSGPDSIKQAVQTCIDFQIGLNCQYLIAPSPLTSDPSTDYHEELAWIDAAIDYVATLPQPSVPLYATVAIADLCLRHSDPLQNMFLDVVADVVSARDVAGVYLVLEQASETGDTRLCGNSRVLRSMLHLTHMFAVNAGMKVGVNFLGAFGLACEAAGASMWADGWYKSLHRLRLADKIAQGRAYPSYWSYPVASDIHLDKDFDKLVSGKQLMALDDQTSASQGLLQAARSGTLVKKVPAWAYRQSNVTATIEHYMLSSIAAEARHAAMSGVDRLSFVEEWLNAAEQASIQVERTLGPGGKTSTRHVLAWREAFTGYRQDHSV